MLIIPLQNFARKQIFFAIFMRNSKFYQLFKYLAVDNVAVVDKKLFKLTAPCR